MSSIPDVSVIVRDGALGIVPPGLNGQLAVMGIASSGPTNAPTAVADIQTLVSTFGSGPLVEAAAHALQIGGGPVVAMRIAAAGTGANGTVTKTGTGSSVATLSGTPVDDYDVIIRIVAGGTNPAAGTTTFQYSLDGGRTWSATITLPTSGIYAIPGTGVTATFSAASLVAGDTYAFHESAPQFTNTELATAMDALIADPNTWFAVHVVGIPADAATYAAMFATLDTKLQGAASTFARYAFAILNAPSLADSALVTAQASLASTRMLTPAGFQNMTSALSGSAYLRPDSWSDAARLAAIAPADDPGWVGGVGPLPGVLSLARDEAKTPGLDAARFMTHQTRVGLNGFFVTKGTMAAPAGSDYSVVTNRRVMDLATTVGRNVLQRYINAAVRVDRTTGLILEQDARSIENAVDSAIRSAIITPGYASDVSVRVDRTSNILSTSQLKATIRILPLAYARYITEDIGLANPALQAQAPAAA